MPLPIAVFISGGGTTLGNLLDYHHRGDLPVEFRLVISSSPSAGGLEIAQRAGIAQRVIKKSDFDDPESYSRAMFDPCRAAGAELVVMGGFLKHVLIPSDFQNRVINIHPSLIPAFCGAGMYGQRVHQAVVDFGAKVSGCTVHFVDNQYDHGPIISQSTCPVYSDDTANSLAQRVFEQECIALPQAILAVAQGRVTVDQRHVEISEMRNE